jgi:hypothetical protein
MVALVKHFIVRGKTMHKTSSNMPFCTRHRSTLTSSIPVTSNILESSKIVIYGMTKETSIFWLGRTSATSVVWTTCTNSKRQEIAKEFIFSSGRGGRKILMLVQSLEDVEDLIMWPRAQSRIIVHRGTREKHERAWTYQFFHSRHPNKTTIEYWF